MVISPPPGPEHLSFPEGLCNDQSINPSLINQSKVSSDQRGSLPTKKAASSQNDGDRVTSVATECYYFPTLKMSAFMFEQKMKE